MPERWKERVELMRNNCRRLLRLVNNLMYFTKHESGTLKLRVRGYDWIKISKELHLVFSELAMSRNMDLFSFKTLDFSRFSFRCIPGAISYRTRYRQHRMPLLAVRIGNDRIDEPFGLLALTIRWTAGPTII